MRAEVRNTNGPKHADRDIYIMEKQGYDRRR